MGFLDIGPLELILIMVVAFLIFGPSKAIEVSRSLGKGVREFRKYSTAMTKDFRGELMKEVEGRATAVSTPSDSKEKQASPGPQTTAQQAEPAVAKPPPVDMSRGE